MFSGIMLQPEHDALRPADVYQRAACAVNFSSVVKPHNKAKCGMQREFTSERVAALLEDRRIRSQDEAAHRAAYQQKIDELTQRLKQTEVALQRTTKDYILGVTLAA